MSRAIHLTRASRHPSGRVLTVAGCLLLAVAATAHNAAAAPISSAAGPDLTKAVGYLVDPSRLVAGHYYQTLPGSGFADFSLTLDGAFALAATGADAGALRRLSDFIGKAGTDATGRSIDAWTGIGTLYASGASIAKQALLAEVMGVDPRRFGGHDLLVALGASICTQVSAGSDTSCPAVGTYRYSPSVFAQSLGIIAQLRAGVSAAAPIAYLEARQHPDGSWPSLIPDTGDSEVDSTAMAVMALALVPGAQAGAAVARGQQWIATRQLGDGGFPGAAGESTNSTALAVQGLTLAAGAYPGPLARARAFLAGEQNADGGFNVALGGPLGSDLRASTQAVGGAVGTSFGVLVALASTPSPTATQSRTPTPSASATMSSTAPASASDPGSNPGSDPSVSVGAAALAAAETLPATGDDLGRSLLVAALLIIAGITLVVAGRRATAERRH